MFFVFICTLGGYMFTESYKLKHFNQGNLNSLLLLLIFLITIFNND